MVNIATSAMINFFIIVYFKIVYTLVSYFWCKDSAIFVLGVRFFPKWVGENPYIPFFTLNKIKKLCHLKKMLYFCMNKSYIYGKGQNSIRL